MNAEEARALFLDHCSAGQAGTLERYGEKPAVAAILFAISGSSVEAGREGDAWDTLNALTGMGTDSDPLSRGMVLNLHFKRPVMQADRDNILAALNLATIRQPEADTGVREAVTTLRGMAEAFQSLAVSTRYDREDRARWQAAYEDAIKVYNILRATPSHEAERTGV